MTRTDRCARRTERGSSLQTDTQQINTHVIYVNQSTNHGFFDLVMYIQNVITGHLLDFSDHNVLLNSAHYLQSTANSHSYPPLSLRATPTSQHPISNRHTEPSPALHFSVLIVHFSRMYVIIRKKRSVTTSISLA